MLTDCPYRDRRSDPGRGSASRRFHGGKDRDYLAAHGRRWGEGA
jgi:hypothetical protein